MVLCVYRDNPVSLTDPVASFAEVLPTELPTWASTLERERQMRTIKDTTLSCARDESSRRFFLLKRTANEKNVLLFLFVSLEVWQQPHVMGRGAARQSSEIPGLREQAGCPCPAPLLVQDQLIIFDA